MRSASETALGRDVTMESFGCGTNSVGLTIEMVNRGLPIDAILFGDTGGEFQRVYEYIPMFSEWLVSRGYPAITVVQHLRRDGTFETLEDECLRTKTLPSIAYGAKRCSGKFKIEPQDKWANHWPLAQAAWADRRPVIKLVGFDVDERRRADKGDEYNVAAWRAAYQAGRSITEIAISAGATQPAKGPAHAASPAERRIRLDWKSIRRRILIALKYEKRYPLIEWEWGRDECVQVIKAAGLPLPGKSACFFCPSSKLHEIKALSPELLKRSLRMESNAEGLTSVRGLGRQFAWKDAVDPAKSSLPMVAPEISCDCHDGIDADEAVL